MHKENAIEVNGVNKVYKLYEDSKERLLDLVTPGEYGKEFYALKDISFKAKQGEVIGFIGVNGSGKSTLANIISGIVPQTSGRVLVNGEVALIAVSAGLKNDLTGRDNIEMKLLMLGFTKKEILNMEPEIIEFSELGEFIDQPVKSYSSGMKSRLGFSISVSIDPDILIIDEALSVGDKAFAEKSLSKMNEFKEQGKTMIFVSHSIGQMKKFCTQILWLEYGQVKDYGEVNEVLPKYEFFLKRWQKLGKEKRSEYKNIAINKGVSSKALEDLLRIEQLNVVKEQYVSKLAHFKSAEKFIYDYPNQSERVKESKNYVKSVYYVKKEATYQGERYYLLSEQPSSTEELVGWVKASDLSVHNYVFIEDVRKEAVFNGKGSYYSKPWGGKKNLIIEDLQQYRGKEIIIISIYRIGTNTWFLAKDHSQFFWINSKYVEI